MKNHFSMEQYLAENKKSFTDFPDLLHLQESNGLEVQTRYQTDRADAIFIDYIAEQMKFLLKECLLKAKYSILQDGSTDTGVS